MNTTTKAAIALTLLASTAAHAQTAVQWKVADGGNGHWYKHVSISGVISWTEARDAAQSSGGHLATISNDGENDFIFQASVPSSWIYRYGPWLGGFQDHSSGEFAEPAGGWRWVTGEPWNFTAWEPAEPNNGCNVDESALHYINYSKRWNDLAESGVCKTPGVNHYMVEWDADCNVDGIVDYGQCQDGALPDYNGNNTPDCCERGEACAVGSYPVQWRFDDGGNGNWYQVSAERESFDMHRQHAAIRGAVIACISNGEENQFVYRVAKVQGIVNPWIGLVQDSAAAEPDQGWRWMDGPDNGWRYWGVGEPNNWQYDEDNCIMVVNPAPWDEAYWSSRWQDYPAFAQLPAVLEWSADCNQDGIIDYGQILQGQLADTNTDGVPDACQCATNPSLPGCCPGDLDHDATVGGADIGLLLSNWGPCGSACLYDLNNDSKVNGGDLGLLLAGWGPCSN